MQRQASAIQQVVTPAVIFCYAFPQSDNTFHWTWLKLPDSSLPLLMLLLPTGECLIRRNRGGVISDHTFVHMYHLSDT